MSCKDEVKQSVLPKITKLKNCLDSAQQDLIVCQNSAEEEIRNDWQVVMDTFSMLRSALNQKESELNSNLQTKKEDICSYFKTELQKIDSQQDSLKQLESQAMTVAGQYPVSETYNPDFNKYRELHEELAQLESELYKPGPVGPWYKDDPRTARSKQDICDTLLRMTSDLDKLDVSVNKQSDNPFGLENSVQGNEPVFYNQQGQTITREEAGYYDDYTDYTYYMLEQEAEAYAYMQAGDTGNQGNYGNNISNYNPNHSRSHNGNSYHQQNPTDYQTWSSNPDDLAYEVDYRYFKVANCNENYMDDEMEAAYEEFLRGQNQGHQ
ncbi:uncharacterized protein LOC110467201 isoform X5 [Mizuhopecten yessoensis]|uniref:uncharacterized protein LOC110467201 isoform X5 n=1 Tax=Mizuhopecten yessoensis TaxID=6573 RepID=UPI000B45EFE3|nr:uncharacterized protein LOC110467201 isoform X5 [Mizuhopecten yessoensis]